MRNFQRKCNMPRPLLRRSLQRKCNMPRPLLRRSLQRKCNILLPLLRRNSRRKCSLPLRPFLLQRQSTMPSRTLLPPRIQDLTPEDPTGTFTARISAAGALPVALLSFAKVVACTATPPQTAEKPDAIRNGMLKATILTATRGLAHCSTRPAQRSRPIHSQRPQPGSSNLQLRSPEFLHRRFSISLRQPFPLLTN